MSPTSTVSTAQPAGSESNAGLMDRRRFLALAGMGVTVTAMPLSFASAAAAQTGPRSLVCVFLAGGADSANIFIPRDFDQAGSTYDTYRTTRGVLAEPANTLIPFDDGQFGFNRLFPEMARIANRGDMAIVQNVGPLARPTTRADFEAGRSIPEVLFSHNSQQKLWQTGRPSLAPSQGWGGRISAVVNGGDEIAPSFSIAGSNIWSSAQDAPYSRVSASVAVSRLRGYDAELRNWIDSFEGVESVMRTALNSARATGNEFDRVLADSIDTAILTTEQLRDATAASAANDVGMDVDGNDLGQQLQVVARLIRNRQSLGMDRQIFFVRMGGWDTHGEQEDRFEELAQEFDEAIGQFQGAVDRLGVTDSVTTFTASDFGRTLGINGDGTDHAWGGHAFVMGGAVNGGTYGTFPSYSTTNNPDDTGDRRDNFAGRLIPTTAVAQHAATLARWMGLSERQLDQVFPELLNFAERDLGFL